MINPYLEQVATPFRWPWKNLMRKTNICKFTLGLKWETCTVVGYENLGLLQKSMVFFAINPYLEVCYQLSLFIAETWYHLLEPYYPLLEAGHHHLEIRYYLLEACYNLLEALYHLLEVWCHLLEARYYLLEVWYQLPKSLIPPSRGRIPSFRGLIPPSKF